MPWVIAIMAALTTIAAAGALALNNLADATEAELSGGVTVQIVDARPAEREQQARAAYGVLSGMNGIVSVERISDAELENLIEPWLGTAGIGQEAVPVPALIDVRLAGEVSPGRLAALRAAIAEVAPAGRVDAQSQWLEPVFAAISSLQWLAMALILLLAATSAAAVWLAARTALGGNRQTIEVVHHLGGTDSQIARIFQRSVTIDAMMSGVAGLAAGLAAIFLLGRQFAALDSGMVASGGFGWNDWLVLAAIPLGGAILAVVTARLTVLAALRRML